jgi:hypothetical protein
VKSVYNLESGVSCFELHDEGLGSIYVLAAAGEG